MPVSLEYNTSARRMSTLNVPRQDIQFDTYDFLMCAPKNDVEDAFEPKDLEASFCRDFACCGLVLSDLHDLLQHYEECHVRLDDEDCSDSENDSWSSISYSAEGTLSVDLEDTKEDLESMKKRAFNYINELCQSDSLDEDSQKKFGKKRTHQHMSGSSIPDAMDLLTQSAVKKIALASMANGSEIPPSLIADEDFLAQAGAILASVNSNLNADKPYKCPVSGCDKAYKNPNGLKYHNQHGHCNLLESDLESLASKPYQCTIGDCGKRYKNLNGLKYHIEHSHMVALNQTLATFGNLLPNTPSHSAHSSPSSSTHSSPMLGTAPITFNMENPSIFPLL
ncbi:hypothetical protein BY458DRAFT_471535 [Sporodiniella umbellata]|nr:hypothetical protein BY458DRAFT_471535 [Sporodiniella umbellata]